MNPDNVFSVIAIGLCILVLGWFLFTRATNPCGLPISYITAAEAKSCGL